MPIASAYSPRPTKYCVWMKIVYELRRWHRNVIRYRNGSFIAVGVSSKWNWTLNRLWIDEQIFVSEMVSFAGRLHFSSSLFRPHHNFQCRRKSFQNQKWYIFWLWVNITFENNLLLPLPNAFKRFVLNLDCKWSCARTEYSYHYYSIDILSPEHNLLLFIIYRKL